MDAVPQCINTHLPACLPAHAPPLLTCLLARYVDAALYLTELKEAGVIGALGVTNFDVPRLEAMINKGAQIASNQVGGEVWALELMLKNWGVNPVAWGHFWVLPSSQ